MVEIVSRIPDHSAAFVLKITPELAVSLVQTSVSELIARTVVSAKTYLDFQPPSVCAELDGKRTLMFT
jgi:hypothetical protein